jgi:acylphosphatase
MPRLTATVSGRVQGVGFREFVRREAAARRITGWVRNADNGRTVELVAEADQATLDALLAAVRRGPPLARVDDVTTAWSDATSTAPHFTIEP